MNDPTRTKVEVSSKSTPMDTTREALWTSIQAFARSDSAWHFQRRDVQALIDFEVKQSGSAQAVESIFDAGRAAGVAEVERRYHNLVEAARLVVAVDRTPTHSIVEAEVVDDQLKIAVDILEAQLGAALASIDGAPQG